MRRPAPSSFDLPVWCIAAALGGGCGFGSSAKVPLVDSGLDIDAVPPTMVDAAPVDMAPGGTLCFGPSGWQVCLDAPPTGVVTLSGTLDTDKSDANNPCLKVQPASWTNALQPDACFIVADKVGVASLNATGRRPLVIVGASAITVTVLLDVGSRRVGPPGAGTQSTECQPFKRNPGTGPGGGGGAGGSFGSPGGNGGEGNQGNRQNGQSADADVGDPARLRGGCAGQPGGNSKAGDAGAGGGAVYLVSGGAISIVGTIDASGGGGSGASAQNGGSGGGAGGMIAVYGASVSTLPTSLVFATGGGGGGGGAASGPPMTSRGSDGQDPLVGLPLAIATGGPGGQVSSGNGGNGGGGFPSTGNTLDGTGGDVNAGGGGGGGAAGFILSNVNLAPATVSPTRPPAPFPRRDVAGLAGGVTPGAPAARMP